MHSQKYRFENYKHFIETAGIFIINMQLIVVKVHGVGKSAHKNLHPPGWTKSAPFMFCYKYNITPLKARSKIDSDKKYLNSEGNQPLYI